MASLAGLNAATRAELESELSAVDGALFAAIDEATGDVWVIRDKDQEPVPLELAVRARLNELGHDAEGVRLTLAVPLESEPRRRVRFVDAGREQEATGTVKVAVDVEWDGAVYRGEASGEKGIAIELKTTGVAVVRALERLADREFRLRVIGVKQIHAFDSEVMVASLLRKTEDQGSKKLVGAAVVEDDMIRAAAIAVLDALNRTLGNFLATND